MWFLRERSGSKITPKFLHEVEGVKLLPQKDTEEFEETVTLERCCGVPISRYSVLDGLTVRRLFVRQVCTTSSIEEMEARAFMNRMDEKKCTVACHQHKGGMRQGICQELS